MESSVVEMTIPIDVFIIAGQSNAAGQGDQQKSPHVLSGKILQVYNGLITSANDPVGNAHTGSAWPAFGKEYHALTGRAVAFVPTAVGGTGLSAYADIGTGHWSGHTFYGQIDLLGDSIAATQTTLAQLSHAGFTPTLMGVLWSQGENEAMNIAKGGILTRDGYAQMLINVITRYRQNLGTELSFYIFKTGTDSNFDDAGFAVIRAAQDNVAATTPNTKIVFHGALSFAARGMLSDSVHYSQEGYNEMGAVGAQAIATK
jgi:hypothetical protein